MYKSWYATGAAVGVIGIAVLAAGWTRHHQDMQRAWTLIFGVALVATASLVLAVAVFKHVRARSR